VDIDYVGTPAVDMPNGMKAGKELRVSGKSEYEFLGDKILKLTDYS
jgi:hypothetical protein